METTVEDLQWDIEKLRKREQKLNKHLAEALEQVRARRGQIEDLRPWFLPFSFAMFSLQLNSGYYVSGSCSGFQGGQITLSMQKVSSGTPPSPLPPQSLLFLFPRHMSLSESVSWPCCTLFFHSFIYLLLNNCRTLVSCFFVLRQGLTMWSVWP